MGGRKTCKDCRWFKLMQNIDEPLGICVSSKKMESGFPKNGNDFACEYFEAKYKGKNTSGGVKHDDGKPKYALLPYDAIEEVAKVLTYGEKKYGARNWEKGMAWDRVFSATMRHLVKWWQKGEDVDPETGINHLAHAACDVLMLLAFQLRGVGEDNRPKGGGTP